MKKWWLTLIVNWICINHQKAVDNLRHEALLISITHERKARLFCYRKGWQGNEKKGQLPLAYLTWLKLDNYWSDTVWSIMSDSSYTWPVLFLSLGTTLRLELSVSIYKGEFVSCTGRFMYPSKTFLFLTWNIESIDAQFKRCIFLDQI